MSWKRFCEINYVKRNYLNCSRHTLDQFKSEALQFITKPHSLLLMGDSGRGKTYFLHSLIYELLETKKVSLAEMRYITAMEIQERVESTGNYFIHSLCDVHYLFIDDFGVEPSVQTAERNYYTITDKRLDNQLPTVFSTNLTEDEILKIYGMRIESRIKQCKTLKFTGPDMRNPSTDKRELCKSYS